MPQRIVTALQRTLRGRNALLNVFELWVGLAGIITGIVFLYDPAAAYKNSLAIVVGHTATAAWALSYFAAGAAIWVGLLKPSPRIEVAGLWVLGSATSINAIAILTVFGLRGAATSITLFTLTAASDIRALFVLRAALYLAGEHDAAAR